jgi:alpha-galactosidase
VEAAVHGDVDLLKQAMLMDPLTAAVCTPPEISQMTDELLVAQAKWLPQYAHAIPAAEKRLASEKPLGTRSTKGAARLKTKTVEEMRSNAEASRRNAAAADKALAKREEQLLKIKKKGRSPRTHREQRSPPLQQRVRREGAPRVKRVGCYGYLP